MPNTPTNWLAFSLLVVFYVLLKSRYGFFWEDRERDAWHFPLSAAFLVCCVTFIGWFAWL